MYSYVTVMHLSLYFLHNKASLTVQSIALCSQLALDPLFSAMVHVQSYRVELTQYLQLISVLVQAAVFIEQDLYGMRHITDCPIEGQLQPKLGEYQGALTKLEVLKEPSSLNFL